MKLEDLEIVPATHLLGTSENRSTPFEAKDYVPALKEGDYALRATFVYHTPVDGQPDGGEAYLLILRKSVPQDNKRVHRNLSDIVEAASIEEELRPSIEAHLVHEYGRVHLTQLELVICENNSGEIVQGDEDQFNFYFVPALPDTERFKNWAPVVSYNRPIWSDTPIVTPIFGFDFTEHVRRVGGQVGVWKIVSVRESLLESDTLLLMVSEAGGKSDYQLPVKSPFKLAGDAYLPEEDSSFQVTFKGEHVWAHDDHLRNTVFRAPARKIRKGDQAIELPKETA